MQVDVITAEETAATEIIFCQTKREKALKRQIHQDEGIINWQKHTHLAR